MKLTPGTVLFGAAVATVITAVAAGLFILGSPTEERARRIDDRRVADLKGIVAATDLYWTRHSGSPVRLPETRKGTSGHTGPGGSAFSSRPKKSSATRWDEIGSQEREEVLLTVRLEDLVEDSTGGE
jgi:hypothetical protein